MAESMSWMIYVLGNFPHPRFLTYTCPPQTSPAGDALATERPSIALNVNTQLLGVRRHHPLPVGRCDPPRIKRSNFNISIFNAVFFRRGTVARFEAKPHAS